MRSLPFKEISLPFCIISGSGTVTATATVLTIFYGLVFIYYNLAMYIFKLMCLQSAWANKIYPN